MPVRRMDGVLRGGGLGLRFGFGTLVGTTLYVDGGYFWYNNGSNHVGPNMWLRALDTSKSFTVNEVDSIPIEFIERPAVVPESSGGDLWTYNGALYGRAGFREGADTNFPGWNTWPKESVFDFWKYDIKTDKWALFQHNPLTTGSVPIKRIKHAQSVVVESLKKAYVINGEVENDNTYANGMLIWDFESEEWQYRDTPWRQWSMGVVNHLSIREAGYIIGFAGQLRQDGQMDKIEIYDVEYKHWINTQNATAGNENMGIPEPRLKPCSVIVPAKDGSSHNIYMFGGYSLDGMKAFAEVWVLSLPSFTWFLVNRGLSTDQEAPGMYEASTCHLVAGGRKMLVYGGRVRAPKLDAACDRTGIHVFDLTTLKWEKDYNPNDGEYEVPKEIYEVIGGDAHGSATLLPQGGMVSTEMESWFKDIIMPEETPNETIQPDPEEGEEETEETKKGLSGGAIGAIIAGGVIGLTLLVFAIFWIRKFKGSKKKDAGVPWPAVAELSTALPPRELHPHGFSPYAQELHAYMPEELGSPVPGYSDVPAGAYYGPGKRNGGGRMAHGVFQYPTSPYYHDHEHGNQGYETNGHGYETNTNSHGYGANGHQR